MQYNKDMVISSSADHTVKLVHPLALSALCTNYMGFIVLYTSKTASFELGKHMQNPRACGMQILTSNNRHAVKVYMQ